MKNRWTLFRRLALLCCILGILMAAEVQASRDNTYNMLLIGSDRRDTSWKGNSDTVILVTVNYDAEQIYVTSFMRDLWADIPGHGVGKLNSAYAKGGGELLAETLASNYDVRVDNYMAVDFVQMAAIVDLMDGVDVEVREEELPQLNSEAEWMASTYGIDAGEPLTEAGMQHLNGAQAVSFCRIRYVGDNDYERTGRQRRVLTSLREKSADMGLAELESVVGKALSLSDNDVGITDTLKILKAVKDTRLWDLVENRVPYDGMFTVENEILTPMDMAETTAKINRLIYGEDNSAAGNYTITIGNDADTIKAVQNALNQAGYDSGKADGYMGRITAQALKDYQRDHGLAESGMIDSEVLASLGIDRN